MNYSLTDKAELIIQAIKQETDTDPTVIFRHIAACDFVNIHGPEHHILDGACLLMAYRNAGGAIDIDWALEKIMGEGLRMPGAACGLWGVCGAVTSMGAALAIIDGTGPLSDDGTWGAHMKFTSKALERLADIDGPRCCKRDAMVAFECAVEYINNHYDVTLDYNGHTCIYSGLNEQCIKNRCPYFPKKKITL